MAIRSTAAVAILGVAAQANAVSLVGEGTEGFKADVYGFARLAASYDLDENIASGGQAGNFSKITTGNGDTVDGHFGMDANTSRLGVSVMTPDDVKIVVEFDFDGSDGLDPRLRHAYGQYQNVLIGRNWSNFNSFVGNTSGLDFDGAPGRAGTQGRTEQIRYTTGPFSVSLEQPSNSLVDAPAKTGSPALTARLEDSAGGVSYSAAVMAKQTGYDVVTPVAADDSVIGYAAFVAGKFAVSDMVSIQGAVGVSEGATGYVYRAGGNFGQADGYVDANGDVETISAFGGTLGASLSLGGGRSVNLGYGTASVDLDDAVQANAYGANGDETTDTNTMIYVNYQWSPVKAVNMGVEFANLETETQGGDSGDANRLMFLAQYNF